MGIAPNWRGRVQKRDRRAGNNIIEFTFLVPWYLMLFVGAFDMGLYSYSLIGVQNAARIGALICSGSATTCADTTIPCSYALSQLTGLPNVGTATITCTSPSPVSVSISYPNGPDGSVAAQVTVNYVSPSLVKIPGILPGQYTATRTVIMRLRG